MYQFFSKPDRYFAPCGDLRCSITEHRVSHVPVFMRGKKALFITDLHARPGTTDADMDALAGRVAALRPDIILLGGDYADKSGPTRRLFERLSGLRAPLGMFGVLGNNDREAFPDISELRHIMARAGFTLLVNESRRIPLDGGALIVAGVIDHRYGRPSVKSLYPEAPEPGCYRLLLSHYPRLSFPLPDLMLCGHTHGGQFNLLGITPYAIGFERLLTPKRASRYIAGLHEYRGTRILVSKGVGASRIPLRIGVKPEINLIRFD